MSAKKAKKTYNQIKETALSQQKPKRKTPFSDIYVIIDHPKQGEVVSGQHYAVRIGASDKGMVEISINDTEWQPCRQSAGYWWFDWSQPNPGNNKIIARLKNEKGRTLKKSIICECQAI
ncbi:MAG: hypothetical protein JW871_03520 [Endomicrobiales bacterium]|nr:hypothetical protein [Endomicrobiales bacterium]